MRPIQEGAVTQHKALLLAALLFFQNPPVHAAAPLSLQSGSQDDLSRWTDQQLSTREQGVEAELARTSRELFDNVDAQLTALGELAGNVLEKTPAGRVIAAAKAIQDLNAVSEQIGKQNGTAAALKSLDYVEQALKAALPDRWKQIEKILAPLPDAIAAANAAAQGDSRGIIETATDAAVKRKIDALKSLGDEAKHELLGQIYDSFKNLTKEVPLYAQYGSLDQKHELLVRELGQVRAEIERRDDRKYETLLPPPLDQQKTRSASSASDGSATQPKTRVDAAPSQATRASQGATNSSVSAPSPSADSSVPAILDQTDHPGSASQPPPTGQAAPIPTGDNPSGQTDQSQQIKDDIDAIDSSLQNPPITLSPLPQQPPTPIDTSQSGQPSGLATMTPQNGQVGQTSPAANSSDQTVQPVVPNGAPPSTQKSASPGVGDTTSVPNNAGKPITIKNDPSQLDQAVNQLSTEEVGPDSPYLGHYLVQPVGSPATDIDMSSSPNQNGGQADGQDTASPQDPNAPAPSLEELQRNLQWSKEQQATAEQDLAAAQKELTREQVEDLKSQSADSQSHSAIKVTVPPGWVPCTCPDQHPGAGIFVNGVQYHTPALHCQ